MEKIVEKKVEKKASLFKMVSFTVCGIVVLDSFVAPAAMGVSSITLWLLTAIVFFIPYGLINAELGATYPEDGGIYAWVKRAFGEFHGTMVAWFYWVSVAFWMPAVFIAFSWWFSLTFAPNLGTFASASITVLMCWVVVGIGIRGVELGIKVTNIAALVKTGVLLMFGGMGVVYAIKYGTANDFALANFALSFDFNSIAFSSAIVYNLLGFELISSIASSIESPEKNIPKMTIMAGVAIAALYIIGTFGVLVAIPADAIDPLDGFFYALQELCTIFGGGSTLAFNIIMSCALFTLVSNMISWSMGSVEILDEAEFSKKTKVLGHRHPKYDTPDYSYILMGCISTVLIILNFALGESANEAFWTILSFSFLVFFLPYVWLFPAAVKLRLKDKDLKRPYQVPFGLPGLLIAAFICLSFILFSIGLLFFTGEGFDSLYHGTLIIGTGLTTIAGIAFYRRSLRKDDNKDDEDIA